MEKLFTPEMSTFFQRYYETRGVAVLSGAKVASFAGNARVSKITLESGQELPTDLVVAGIGVAPAIELFEKTELRLDDGVVVNEYLETNVLDVYAAGDVANYYDVLFKKQRRIEHWNNAVEQGKYAARLLAGEHKPFVEVPYFFSDVFDLSWEFWGDTADADQVVHRGEVASGSFSVWWLREGRLVAAFVLNRPDEERELAPEWIKVGCRVSVELLQDVTKPLNS